jgi:VIT1/CCC1 family predicted Fe2+/Mn2+ transporter
MTSRIKEVQKAFNEKDIELARKLHQKEHIRKSVHDEKHSEGKGQYLGEFVYGAIDGTVTTFAVVSGATGAALDPVIVVILGFANLIADGFSMACGNFLSERTQKDYIDRERKREEWEIKNMPEGEKEEIREIYRKKGFKGKYLEKAVEIISSDKKVWVDTMMADELGLIESSKSPLKTAGVTYFGFFAVGLIPLLAYVFSYLHPFFKAYTFPLAVFMTLIALFIIGVVKRRVTKKNLFVSAFETIFIGGAAAFLAYVTGYFIRLLMLP